jgi:hypothetical protein
MSTYAHILPSIVCEDSRLAAAMESSIGCEELNNRHEKINVTSDETYAEKGSIEVILKVIEV